MIKWIITTLSRSKQFFDNDAISMVLNNDFHENLKLINVRLADILHQRPKQTNIPKKFKALFTYLSDEMKETIKQASK